jgi:hypothetical protein
MKRLFPLPALLGLLFLLGACTSYDAQMEPGKNFTGLQKFFVVSNHNDNHGLDRLIASSLTARGFAAEIGPLTMMGDDTQAIVTYQDRWAWDFGDHLVYLQFNVRNPKNNQPFATASFGAKVPTRKSIDVIVDELVAKLMGARKS